LNRTKQTATASGDQADILIIGAGAAGLSAASALSASGLRVIVLEARDRVGGRIFTYKDQSTSLPIELGAEFVHGKPPEIFDLVGPAKLLLCDVTNRHWYLSDGTLMKSAEFWLQVNDIMEEMARVGDTDCSFQEFLDWLPNNEKTQEAKSMATRYVEGFHAADTRIIGIRGLIRANKASDRIGGDHQFRFIGGYGGLIEWLAESARRRGTAIHLKTVVKEVHWHRKMVEIVCDSANEERRFKATLAVVTLPLGVLQINDDGAVKFNPQLAQEKQEAIRTLAMGNVVRVVLVFRERFWESLELPCEGDQERLVDLGFIHSSDVTFASWWTQLPIRVPIFVGWAGGPNSESLIYRDERFIMDQAIGSLATILKVDHSYLRELLECSYLHNWYSDAFSHGAYSYVPVNGVEAQMVLSRPAENTLFFAGEATSSEGHVGTVHGALASGKRVANEILRSLQDPTKEN